MSDLQSIQNKMISLESDDEPQQVEEINDSDLKIDLKIDPLSSVNMFKKEKESIKMDDLSVPPTINKKIKVKRKLTDAHKKALELGRLKGLEKRRLNRLKKKQEKINLQKEQVKINIKPDTPKEEVLKLISDPPIRQKLERQSYAPRPSQEDDFEKFYNMMDKYQNIKQKQYILAKEKQRKIQIKKQQEKQQMIQKQTKIKKVNVKVKNSLYANNKKSEIDYSSYFS